MFIFPPRLSLSPESEFFPLLPISPFFFSLSPFHISFATSLTQISSALVFVKDPCWANCKYNKEEEEMVKKTPIPFFPLRCFSVAWGGNVVKKPLTYLLYFPVLSLFFYRYLSIYLPVDLFCLLLSLPSPPPFSPSLFPYPTTRRSVRVNYKKIYSHWILKL